MSVFVAQHGEAAPKDRDPARNLTEKGESDIVKMAEFIRPMDYKCAVVFHSGKARAARTAELLGAAFNAERISERGDINPNAPVEAVAAELKSLGENAALVGHMPFVGSLVSRMVGADPGNPVVNFTPGTVVHLSRGEDGRMRIEWVLRPDMLK